MRNNDLDSSDSSLKINRKKINSKNISNGDIEQRRSLGRILGGAIISSAALSTSTFASTGISSHNLPVFFNDYKELRNYIGTVEVAFITGYVHAQIPSGIAGLFIIDPTDNKSIDDGGITIVDIIGRRWKRIYNGLVDVKWFGARGDGIHNDAPIISKIIKLGYTPFFSDGVYFFSEPVYITFDIPNAVRMVGTSQAGYSGISPNGSTIVGSEGLEAFFIFTKSNLATQGEFAFECVNINFQGKNKVLSALKNVIGGGPARPFIVRNCTFQGFSLSAIISDITKSGLTTGLCNVTISENNFTENKLAVLASGQSAIMGLDFSNNVCEHNFGGIVSNKLGFGGGIRIADNLLEGQPNSIVLDVGLGNIEITRNYFEQNSEIIASVTCSNIKTLVQIHNNFILDCKGFVRFHNCELHCSQNFDAEGIPMVVNSLSGKSFINNNGLIYPNSLIENTLSFDINFMQKKSFIPDGVNFGLWLKFSEKNLEKTPIGIVGVQTVAERSKNIFYPVNVVKGDRVVVFSLFRCRDKIKTNIKLNIYSDKNVLIGSTGPVRIGPVSKSDWIFVAHTAQITVGNHKGVFIQWVSSDTCDISDSFVYKIESQKSDAPIQIFLPSKEHVSDFWILRQTDFVDGVSIVDTSLSTTIPFFRYGDNAVYELNIIANENGFVFVGMIVILSETKINKKSLKIELFKNFERTDFEKSIDVSVAFWDGFDEHRVLNDTSLTGMIRIKIKGYSSRYVADSQLIKLSKKI